jgi:hypothetical protein
LTQREIRVDEITSSRSLKRPTREEIIGGRFPARTLFGEAGAGLELHLIIASTSVFDKEEFRISLLNFPTRLDVRSMKSDLRGSFHVLID